MATSRSKIRTDSMFREVMNLAKEFVEIIDGSIKLMVEAAEMYVEVLDKYPKFAPAFRAKYRCSIGWWKQLERVGRGEIIPEIIMPYGNVGMEKLEVFPIEVQRRLVNKKVDVVFIERERKEINYIVRKVDIRDLSTGQANQVFSKTSIRNADEQREYLQSISDLKISKIRERAHILNNPWKVVNKNEVLITTPPEGMKFTKAMIMDMLAALKRAK